MRAHRGKRGCKRSCRTSATGQPRQTSNASAGVEVGWRVKPALSLDQRRRTEDGAPYDVWESFRIVITPSVIQRKGRRERRPLRWLRDSGFSGAVRCSLSNPVTFFYVASPVSLPPVGCTVLGAPWLRDCRGGLDAVVRPDRFCPRHPRCVNRAFTDQRFIFRGHSPRTIFTGAPTLPVNPRRAGVEDKPLRWIG